MNIFLQFSDAAKFADVARNLVQGLGYGRSFSFFGGKTFENILEPLSPASGVLPVMPYSIAAFFKVLGITDFAVIATSFFYFILTLVFVFLLAKKIFKSNFVGVLSALVVGFNLDLINYATGGASEAPFIFEIVAGAYFISLRKKWATIIALIFAILIYFTRPLGFIYIAGFLLYWFLNTFKRKKAIIYFAMVLLIGIMVDRLVLLPLNGKMFIYSVTGRGVNSALAQATSSTTSDALRGITINDGLNNITQILKNIFYNLYNFFKLLPQIMSPYLFALFTIGIFKWGKDKAQNSFKIATIFMTVITLLVTATSIPFFRYLHPVVPLIYIFAVGTLVEILNFMISKQTLVILVSTFLILLFGVVQTLGALILDSRFERNTHNVGKPPVYVKLSKILKENTTSNQIVVTNLDTWGSWYGERRTVWFPLEPKQLIDPKNGKVPFNAIYLTSYLIDDENYYMGEGWRNIFNNPNDSSKWTCGMCNEISKEFILKDVYYIDRNENYEKQNAKAVLFVKK